MKVFTQFMLLLLFSLSSFGQINMADSTVSVVGYWAIGDSLSYNVSHVEYKLKGDTAAYDTTEYMKLTYEVDITIKDSTENSYTIEWLYRGHSIQSEDSIIQKLATVLEDIAVLIKTDEFGAVQGIENWEEVRGKINDIATKMAPFIKDIPNGKQLLEEAMNPFQTKEGLEGNLIDDAIQFYTYHGKMYDTDKELKGEVQIQNQVIG